MCVCVCFLRTTKGESWPPQITKPKDGGGWSHIRSSTGSLLQARHVGGPSLALFQLHILRETRGMPSEHAPFSSFRLCSRLPNSGPKVPKLASVACPASTLATVQWADSAAVSPPLDQGIAWGQLQWGVGGGVGEWGMEGTWNLDPLWSPGLQAGPPSLQAELAVREVRRSLSLRLLFAPSPQALHMLTQSLISGSCRWDMSPTPHTFFRSEI